MVFSGDLFGDPEWPPFGGGGRTPGGRGPVLAAVSLETRAESYPWERDALVVANSREVARAVFGSRALSAHRAFLFVTHASWRSTENRVARYMLERDGLWRGLEKERDRDLGLFGRRSAEVAFESDKGVRYAGMLEVGEEALGPALEMIRVAEEGSSFVCALVLSDRPGTGSEADVRALYETAAITADTVHMRPTGTDWRRLCVELCPLGWAVGRTTGAFDDPWVDTDLFLPGDLGLALAEELSAG